MQKDLLNMVENKLKGKFDEAIVSFEMLYDFPVFEIKKEFIHEVIRFLFDEVEMKFHFLTDLCGLHFPDNKGKELGVMYQLHNMPKNYRIRLKTFVPVSHPEVDTISDIFSAANWMERETYDFYGILFKNHPDLRRILNMDEMNYFPMRKEFPLEDGTRDDKQDFMFGR